MSHRENEADEGGEAVCSKDREKLSKNKRFVISRHCFRYFVQMCRVTKAGLVNVHRVSKKLCKLIFCQNFVKF